MSQTYISGVFVDKAGGFGCPGVSKSRAAAWNSAHGELLQSLGAATAAYGKQLIFNNVGGLTSPQQGQLFERWGQFTDHDGLSVQQDMALLENLTAASGAGQLLSLARGGGGTPGSANASLPETCGASLAAMLLAVASPDAAFFACMPDFNVIHGWMNLSQTPIYERHLGAPLGKAVVGKDGLLTRAFAGANVSLNISAFTPERVGSLNRGCVRWASGQTTGACPN
jgi:hypothetical protein